MARVLVVSDAIGLSLRLADAHQVVDHPASRVASIDPDPQVDVVILDLGDPSSALAAVERLRGAGRLVPVLIVAGYQPTWHGVASLPLANAQVVPLPITREALLAGIANLLRQSDRVPHAAPQQAAAEVSSTTPAIGSSAPKWLVTSSLARPFVTEEPTAPSDQPDPLEEQQATDTSSDTGEDEPRSPAGSGPPPDRGRPQDEPTDRGTAHDEAHDEVGELAAPDPPSNGLAAAALSPQERALRLGLLSKRGRSTGASSLARRLAERGYSTSLGPGGTSAELIALGLHAAEEAETAAEALLDPANRHRTAPPPALARGTPAALPQRAGTVEQAVSGLSRSLGAAQVARTASAPAAIPSRPATQRAAAELVRMLTERADEVFGVNDTAQVLAEDVVERTDADATAVLVPDGTRWRVSAGVGLRPLERRLTVTEDHWLLAQTVTAGTAVLVEDSDAFRTRLVGAPLAAWKHLLAVPVPDVKAVVVVARGQEAPAFSPRELKLVVDVVKEAAPLLIDALKARSLARLLSALRDEDATGAY